MRTFGVDPELYRESCWTNVYFGNYVEKLCGIRDSQAKNAIEDNRNQYNQSLFSFIIDNGIDYVFCFSRRVYSALPQLAKLDSENDVDGDDAHRLERRIYYPGSRENLDINLDKPVTFYGLRHTSQGFSYRKYQDRIKKVIQEHGLPF